MSSETIDAPARHGLVRRILKLVILLIGACALLGAGFGAGFFYFAKPLSPAQDLLRLIDAAGNAAGMDGSEGGMAVDGGAAKVPRPVPESSKFITSYYTFPDTLTTNLTGSRKFLQVEIGLSTQYDASVITHVETHQLALRSDILVVTAGFTEDQLGTPEGRDALAAAIRDAINRRLQELEGFGGVEHVFFPSFIIQ
jgi:flagellar protein FliL